MSHDYVAVQWNRRKKVYDLALWLGIAIYLAVFMAVSIVQHPGVDALSPMTLLIRALATLAFFLLSLILCIGPLARLSPRFLPLLYNRRHMGVSMFIVALTHAVLAAIWYHSFGVENPVMSILTSPGSFESAADVAFQPFGFFALLILFVMAATSHDYWNANLGAPLWKALHMGVYLAYGLLVVHVALGAMQDASTGLLPAMPGLSVVLVGGLHLAAAFKSRTADREISTGGNRINENWINLGSWRDIENNSAITVAVANDERVAVFRYEGNKLAAVANVCKHQNGPLGEGRVIDGCITCPWHGFQYRPEDGRAPAPFEERIATYLLKLEGENILLNSEALPEGSERPITEIANMTRSDQV